MMRLGRGLVAECPNISYVGIGHSQTIPKDNMEFCQLMYPLQELTKLCLYSKRRIDTEIMKKKVRECVYVSGYSFTETSKGSQILEIKASE